MRGGVLVENSSPEPLLALVTIASCHIDKLKTVFLTGIAGNLSLISLFFFNMVNSIWWMCYSHCLTWTSVREWTFIQKSDLMRYVLAIDEIFFNFADWLQAWLSYHVMILLLSLAYCLNAIADSTYKKPNRNLTEDAVWLVDREFTLLGSNGPEEWTFANKQYRWPLSTVRINEYDEIFLRLFSPSYWTSYL